MHNICRGRVQTPDTTVISHRFFFFLTNKMDIVKHAGLFKPIYLTSSHEFVIQNWKTERRL